MTQKRYICCSDSVPRGKHTKWDRAHSLQPSSVIGYTSVHIS